jgi:hypothetical protein
MSLKFIANEQHGALTGPRRTIHYTAVSQALRKGQVGEKRAEAFTVIRFGASSSLPIILR